MPGIALIRRHTVIVPRLGVHTVHAEQFDLAVVDKRGDGPNHPHSFVIKIAPAGTGEHNKGYSPVTVYLQGHLPAEMVAVPDMFFNMHFSALLGCLNKFGYLLDLGKLGRTKHIPRVPQGTAENAGHAGHLDHTLPVSIHDLRVGVPVGVAVFAAGIAAMVIAQIGDFQAAGCDHLSPHAVYVDVGSVVEHVGGVPPRRTHVDLESHVSVRGGLEKFDVKKSLLDGKGLDTLPAQLFQCGGDVTQGAIADMAILIDGLHDALAVGVGRVVDNAAVGIGQPVK